MRKDVRRPLSYACDNSKIFVRFSLLPLSSDVALQAVVPPRLRRKYPWENSPKSSPRNAAGGGAASPVDPVFSGKLLTPVATIIAQMTPKKVRARACVYLLMSCARFGALPRLFGYCDSYLDTWEACLQRLSRGSPALFACFVLEA